MNKKIKLEKITEFKLMRDEMTLQDALKEANRCLLCKDAPCSRDCPAGTDPGKFIRQIKFENIKGAARTIRENNIAGYICGLVCPAAETCQKACSVAALEDPIDIIGLQRFACEYAEKLGLEPMQATQQYEEKVAVIGSGPAGMSCAAALAKKGYPVTVFEKEKQAGGVARWNMPDYRISQKVVDDDLKNLLSLGVIIQYETDLKNSAQIQDLFKQGFKAIFIGVGLAEPITPQMLVGYDNTVNYIDFLKRIKLERDKCDLQGKRVVAIGGGSVAMDVACAAAAMGAHATVIYRRTEQEMPAYSEEIELAHLLGVNFRFNSVITGTEIHANQIKHLEGHEILWNKQKTESNIIDDSSFKLPVDYVVPAIGTKPSALLATIFPDIKLTDKGAIAIHDDFSTNLPGIFSAGDVVNGGQSVAIAVGEGKEAAASIDRFLRG